MRPANIWHSTLVRLLRISVFDKGSHQGSHQRPGGTNLRVCLVTLNGGGKFEITQSKYRLTEEQKHDDGQKLFDFCADCVKTFIDSNIGNSEDLIKDGVKLPLGFTVRFSGNHRSGLCDVPLIAKIDIVFISMLVRIPHLNP